MADVKCCQKVYENEGWWLDAFMSGTRGSGVYTDVGGGRF